MLFSFSLYSLSIHKFYFYFFFFPKDIKQLTKIFIREKISLSKKSKNKMEKGEMGKELRGCLVHGNREWE